MDTDNNALAEIIVVSFTRQSNLLFTDTIEAPRSPPRSNSRGSIGTSKRGMLGREGAYSEKINISKYIVSYRKPLYLILYVVLGA